MHNYEHSVHLCRPNVPTNIKGFRWPLLGQSVDTLGDSNDDTGSSVGDTVSRSNVVTPSTHTQQSLIPPPGKYRIKESLRDLELDRRQVALYFRDTGGKSLGGPRVKKF